MPIINFKLRRMVTARFANLYFRGVHRMLFSADTGKSPTCGELPLWYNLRAENNDRPQREGNTASLE